MATIKRGNPDQEKIKYIKGTFFAIRPDSDKELFWLAVSLEDVTAKDKEVYVRWLNTNPSDELEYKTGPEQSSKIPIESILLKTQMKQNSKDQNSYKISKKELTRIKDFAKYDEEDEEDEEEEDEDEEEEEEEEEVKIEQPKKTTAPVKKETAATSTAAKKKESTPKKTTKKETPKKKETKSNGKKSKKEESEEEESEESEEESEEEDSEEEKKSKKKKTPAKTKKEVKKKESKSPKKSTKKSTKKSKKDESEEEEEDSESEQESEESEVETKKKSKTKADTSKTKKRKKSDESEEEESESEDQQEIKEITTGKKRVKTESGKSKKAVAPEKEKKKSAAALKAELRLQSKKGNPNPAKPMEPYDPTWESTSNEIEYCCAFCMVREATRAVLTKNMTLLKAIVAREDFKYLTVPPTAKSRVSPLELAVQENYHEAIKIILDDMKNEKKPRANLPQFHEADTGSYSQYTYGHAIRKVNIARGNKQGDEAFNQDKESYNHESDFSDLSTSLALFICSSTKKISLATIDLLATYFTDFKDNIDSNIVQVLRAGNLELSSYIVKSLFDRTGFGYNILHVQSLSTSGVDFDAYKSVSVTKKTDSFNVTPIHHAAINPNGKYLKQLLETLPQEHSRPDHNQFKPIHYAAASTAPVNLNFLLSKGADPNDLGGHSGMTALNIACKLGRVENVKALIKFHKNSQTEYVNYKNKKNQVALHFAAQNGNPEIIKALLDAGADTALQEKITRDTPLMKAAEHGHLEAVKMLVEHGKADVDKKDKYKATALFRAIINGDLKVASYLIHMNTDMKVLDSSRNTVLHYAAAYGWYDITKYLVERYKVAVNENNDWKSTPLSLTIKKNHLRVAKFLMNNGADGNVCDEDGRSLLLQCITEVSESIVPTISFLVEKSKAAVNHVDVEGDGPLHYLAELTSYTHAMKPRVVQHYWAYNRQNNDNQTFTTEQIATYNQVFEKTYKAINAISKILIDNGADINLANKRGETPLMLSFSGSNVVMCKWLLSHGASIKGHDQNGRNILHMSFFKLLEEYHLSFSVIADLLLAKPQVAELVSEYGSDGLTPVMAILANFANTPVFKTSKEREELFEKYFEILLKNSKADITLVEDKTKYVKPTAAGKSKNDKMDVDEDDEDVDMTHDDDEDEDDDENEDEDEDEDEDDENEDDDEDEDEDDEDDDEPKKKASSEKETSLNRSILHFSVSTDSEKIVKILLNMKPKSLDPLDSKKRTPLLFSIECSRFPIAMLFVDHGCNVTLPNETGNTPLHLSCISMNLPLIKKLLQKKSPVNQKNNKGLTPLMLSCQNKHNVSDGSLEGEDNPISLLLKNGADAKLLDKKNRTALHYAINASTGDANSSFEAEDLLLKHQAPLNPVDFLGRTPLHYCFIKMGFNAIKDSSSVDPIQMVSSLCSYKDIKIDLPDKFGRTPLHYAAQHGSTVSALHLLQRGANINREDEDKNSPLAISLISSHPDCAISLIQKNANVKTQLTTFKVNRVETEVAETEQNGDSNHTEYIHKGGKKYKVSYTKDNVVTCGIFYHVVKNNWQGVAYIMLDSGLDSFSALRDAFKADKYQLALTLLGKIRDPKELGVVSQPEKRNLFHYIGMHPSSIANFSLRVQQKLLEAKVSPNTADHKGRTPFHYAIKRSNMQFVNFLLDNKLDINAKDSKGYSPISLALLQISAKCPPNQTIDGYPVIKLLVSNKPNLDILFPYGQDQKVTPLIYSILLKNMVLVRYFLQSKANVNTPDVDGLTPIMHAVRVNSVEITGLLLASKPNLAAQDQEKKTVVHHVVNPTDYGSYENTKLLTMVIKAGAPVDTPDLAGKTANFYASLQDDGKMSEVLVSHGAKKVAPSSLPSRETSVISVWNNINYEEDYEKHMAKINEENASREPLKPVVDPQSGLAENSEVYVDESGLIYDVLLTKVDARKGMYGENNFYVLQLIYNKQKDNYYIFNRYGRIGETGLHQCTPYPKEDCITEFQKIFKSKTGNAFAATGFQRQTGKYNLIAIDRTNRAKKKVLQPFKFEQYPASKLPKEIQAVMKDFCNVEAIEAQLSSLKIDSNIMPLGRISKDHITQAVTILSKLNEKMTEYKKLQGETKNEDIYNQMTEILSQQYNLSNQFYELIPHANFARSKMNIIQNEKVISEKLNQLKNLDELELVSKILIAAHDNTSLHPYDYCFSAMGVSLELIDSSSAEHKAISNYSKNTGCNGRVTGIFKLQRKGEAERIQVHRSLKNHFLLWHGSRTTNYMSILAQGLKVAPPEAPVTGYMFGKGIYFSDMFKKSKGYCGGGDHDYLLLSEVALGTMAELKSATYLESPMPSTNSTKGMGREGPDFNDSIILNNGVTIPLGTPIENPRESFEYLQMNEYIVYDSSQVRMRYLVQTSK